MHPRLLATPVFTLYTFGVLLATAYAAAFWWLMREGRRKGLDPEMLGSLGLWAIVGALIGAKVLMMVRDPSDYLTMPLAISSRAVLTSAGDFYGGFIGALIASALFFRRHPQLPFWPTADLTGPSIALGQAIGRVGCFMAGDDYGRAGDVPWAVTFTDPEAARIGGVPLGVPLHPVQLYESMVCLLLFGMLVRLSRHKRFDGQVILTYTLVYAVARFVLEFFRGDADRGFVLGGLLSTSQFIAVLLAPAALLLYYHRRQRNLAGSSNRHAARAEARRRSRP